VNDSHVGGPLDRGQQARLCLVSFETFYKTYRTRLVRFLKTQASNSDWAEDVADEAMMAVWDKWDELLNYERPDSWLFKVATRKLRHLESRAREDCGLHEDVASSGSDLQFAAVTDQWVEVHLDLIAAMRSLPRRQGEVIGLHYFGGYTIAETAHILGIHEGTAKKHLNRGLENLRVSQGLPDAAKRTGRIPA
jgi:RNA polymerase sigma factor (sigma-70 family)